MAGTIGVILLHTKSMTVINIKGRDYSPVTLKDSYDRRAQQYFNNIVASLRSAGLSDNDIDMEIEPTAFRNLPASASWWMNDRRCHYSYAGRTKYAENLYIVSRVIDAEIQALLKDEQPIEDFVTKFAEDKDVATTRAKARETLGLSPDERDMDVINRAYKAMAKEHHPDTENGNMDEFKRINNAHKALKRELS